ncbi:MAG: UDP-glucose 4-epimerase GalE [Myxococcota bacterium]|jgi:UDP-glucose-4-epimerase GalE|nr:UDP-glucose 4-epimerase GalE [Myxococcota bacterium]
MRVLVTGGAGYVGSHTVWALREQGATVVVFDDLSTGLPELIGDTPLVVGSLGDRPLLEETLRHQGIEAVVHFAARAVVPESLRDPLGYWQNNVAGTLSLVQAAVAVGVRRLVFSSTAGVYGPAPAGPLVEERPVEPHHPYGRTKRAVEVLLDDCVRAGLLRAVALRYFNAAGADAGGRTGELHDPETHLIPLLLGAASGERDPITVFGDDYPTRDGTAERDYVHVADLARAHLAALAFLGGGEPLSELQIVNLGSGRGHTVREVLAAAEEAIGRAIPWTVGPRRAGDPPRLVAEIGRARQVLGWAPQVSDLPSLLASAWRWHGSATRAAWRQRQGR